MIPVDQTQFVPKTGKDAGNCLAAAIASVLELPLEAVPNFAAIEDGEDVRGIPPWARAMETWLHSQGWARVVWTWSTGVYVQEGAWALLHGPSPRGDYLHTIVAQADAEGWVFVHDPHPDRTYFDGRDPVEVWTLALVRP